MKKIISFLFLVIISSFLFSIPAQADEFGLEATVKGTGIPHATGVTLASKIGQIVGVALSLIGIVFFGLMLYGGYLWMMAKGDQSQADKAQSIITDAVIGLVVVGASYIITKLVFTAVK